MINRDVQVDAENPKSHRERQDPADAQEPFTLSSRLAADARAVEILKLRARRLAEAPEDDGVATDHIEVVVFTLGPELYALETRFVRETAPLRSLTPLPGVPAHIAGLTNLRSEVVSVVNLAVILKASIEKQAGPFVLYLQDGAMSFGAAVDTIVGVRDIVITDLHESGASLSGIRHAYLRGITLDGVALLDAHAMLMDERLVVRN